MTELLGDALPADHAGQVLADHYIDREIGREPGRPWRVLDLGCGVGDSVDAFRARDPQVEWVGIDVPGSPEARERTRTDARFETFDGIALPFEDGSFDLVFCKQVLEHVRHPEPLLSEVARVLAPGGFFAGSTSQLEPYHSLSRVELHAGRAGGAVPGGRPDAGRGPARDRLADADRLANDRPPGVVRALVGAPVAAQPGARPLRPREPASTRDC